MMKLINFRVLNMEELFDKMIKRYSETEEFLIWTDNVNNGLEKVEEILIKKYFTNKKGKILDIGCGGGREAIALYKMGYTNIIGIDFVKKIIKKARENARNYGTDIIFKVGNAVDLKFQENEFDYIVMFKQCYGHIPKRINRLKALKEAKRVLKDNGFIILTTSWMNSRFVYRFYFFFMNIVRRFYNPFNLESNDAFIFRTGGKYNFLKSFKKRAVFHWHNPEEIIEDAREVGLEVLKMEIGYRIASQNKKEFKNKMLYCVLRRENNEIQK